MKKFRKGDKVKVIKSMKGKGYDVYGIRKGSVGIVLRSELFRGETTHRVEFKNANKSLSSDLKLVRKSFLSSELELIRE